MNDSYQESYQSWEIVDYEEFPNGGWPASRRCGHAFYSYYSSRNWYYCVADSRGLYVTYRDSTEHRCDCPTKYGPYKADGSTDPNTYTAVCQHQYWILSYNYDTGWNNSSSAAWVRSHECPKGWGKYHAAGTDKPYVQCAQGYVPTGYKEPIYGYVTRYRDVYYDYISTRISKI